METNERKDQCGHMKWNHTFRSITGREREIHSSSPLAALLRGLSDIGYACAGVCSIWNFKTSIKLARLAASFHYW